MKSTSQSIHVLGMAKSCLDLRGAKAAKLELDFFKLLVAVERIIRDGGMAQGYLLVFTKEIETTVNGWRKKYAAGNLVRALPACLDSATLAILRQEKAGHAAALLLKGEITQAEKELSVAAQGKELGESHLRHLIEMAHPGIQCLPAKSPAQMPLNTAWDYYGTVPA